MLNNRTKPNEGPTPSHLQTINSMHSTWNVLLIEVIVLQHSIGTSTGGSQPITMPLSCVITLQYAAEY